jgi:hypothetical protein
MRHAALVLVALAGCSIKHRSDDIIDAPPGTIDPDANVNPDTGKPPDAPDPFDVREVPGLVIWLDGAQGVTKDNSNRVSRWADQSGAGNDAVAPSETTRPEFVSNSMNGQPAIKFGVNRQPQLSMKDAESLRWGTDDFVLIVVTKFQNNPNSDVDGVGTLVSKGGNGSGFGLFGNLDGGPIGTGSGGSTGRVAQVANSRVVRAPGEFNNGKPHVIALRRVEDVLELRVDSGVAAMVTGANNISVNTTSAVLIGSLAGGQFARLDGDIAEVIAVVGEATVTHIDQLESYLLDRYGL